ALAWPHSRAGEALDLVLVDGTVAQHGVEATGLHLRRFPLEVARRLDLDELAPRHLFALADVDIPASGVDQRLEPGLPGGVDCPLPLPSPPPWERDVRAETERTGGGEAGTAPLGAGDLWIGEHAVVDSRTVAGREDGRDARPHLVIDHGHPAAERGGELE